MCPTKGIEVQGLGAELWGPKENARNPNFPALREKRRETRHGRAVTPIDLPFGMVMHQDALLHILGGGRGTPSGLCMVGP